MVTAPDVVLRRAPVDNAIPVARLETTVLARLKACKTGWCQVEVGDLRGWLPNDTIFGLNAGERRSP